MNAIERMIGRLFMIGVDGLSLTKDSRKALHTIQPGFVILFSRNISDRNQVLGLVDEIQQELEVPAVICIDQEGGIVTRLDEGFSVSPGAMAIAATGNPANAFAVGKIMGWEMRNTRITWDLAPVADLNTNPLNPSLGVRSFGDQAPVAIPFIKAFYQGLKAAQIAGCAKHFPGYGDVSLDPHLDLPTMEQDLSQLQTREFLPFQDLMREGIETIMPTHVFLPKIQQSKKPASMDPDILLKILRGSLNYQGLIVADDLLMKGVFDFYAPEESVQEGLLAGLDVLTICHEPSVQQSAFTHLARWVETNPTVHRLLKEKFDRVEGFRNRFLPIYDIEPRFDPQGIKIMEQIALDSITLFKNDDYLVPLPPLGSEDLIVSTKLSRQSQAEERLGKPDLLQQLSLHFPKVDTLQIDPSLMPEEALSITKNLKGKVCVFLSENAYLHQGQKEMIWDLMARFDRFLLISLRNPYDAGIEGLRNCLMTYGYAQPSQKAVFDILLGKHHPTGKCPVKIHLVPR